MQNGLGKPSPRTLLLFDKHCVLLPSEATMVHHSILVETKPDTEVRRIVQVRQNPASVSSGLPSPSQVVLGGILVDEIDSAAKFSSFDF